MLSALLAAAAIVVILAVASALWRAVGRWEAAALAEVALDDQSLARSIAACFSSEVVEEITVEPSEGDVVILHPGRPGGWQ